MKDGGPAFRRLIYDSKQDQISGHEITRGEYDGLCSRVYCSCGWDGNRPSVRRAYHSWKSHALNPNAGFQPAAMLRERKANDE